MKSKPAIKCPYKKITKYKACSALANKGKIACFRCAKLKNYLKKEGIDIGKFLKLKRK